MSTTADLSGKVAWITGAGRGLGRAIAEGLAARGATLAVTARSERELKELAAQAPTDVLVLPGSVDDAAFVSDAARRIVSELGSLDVMVTMAGISPTVSRSEDLSDESWSRVLSVNLDGTFYCCREAGKHMLAAGGGSIITVSSVHGRHGIPRQLAYSASKGAVEQLTRTLAAEWADRGVRVNCLAPGYFLTPLTEDYVNSRHGLKAQARIPLGRLGEASEIIGASAFLASDDAAYITGSVLTIDGGWTSA